MKKSFQVWLLICACTLSLQAQHKPLTQSASIKVISDIQKDHIALRWVVDQPLAWKRSNEYGFRLTRTTVSRNGAILKLPVTKDLGVFKPAPLEEWEPWVHDSDEAAIVAQSIYGEYFEVESGEQDIAVIINQSEELDQRFAFALMAADKDFEIAQLAGWGYADYDVLPGEKYLYRITGLTPPDKLKPYGGKIETGIRYISLDDYEELPVPIDFGATFGDRQVMLSWDYQLLKNTYNAYYLERSNDGENYQPLSDIPLVNLNNKPGKPAQIMFYIDSIPHNNTPYYYRLQGVSSFGYKGPYTEAIKGQGKSLLHYSARISKTSINDDNSVTLSWEFPGEGEAHIKGFCLMHSTHANGEYKIVKENIISSFRQLRYGPLEASNYFKIRALGVDGDNKDSYPSLVQPIDSIPPAVPVNLVGEIDSLGVARINWQANTEPDLLGYRVFKANVETEEFVQITGEPITNAHFTDTLELKSLNSRVYYKLVAVDKRYNMSDYSIALMLEKPDVIPPQPPVFSSYKVEGGSVKIEFVKSYSADVSKHLLYRQNLSDKEEKLKGFKLVYTTEEPSGKIYAYTDTDVKANHYYQYALFAEDNSGLRSDVSQPLTVKVFSVEAPEALTQLGYVINRESKAIELHWYTLRDDIKQMQVYKSTNDGKPALLAELPGTITQLSDNKVKAGTTYTYTLRAVLINGHFSKMEIVKVDY